MAYAKEHDGQLKASTNGAQASNHIGAQAFANSAGFTYIDLPQGNTADELLSLRGGEADFCVVRVADIASMKSEVKVLGVFSPERLTEEGMEDVPTLGELDYYDQWLGSACWSLFWGGLLSCISLYFFAPMLAQLALKFMSA